MFFQNFKFFNFENFDTALPGACNAECINKEMVKAGVTRRPGRGAGHGSILYVVDVHLEVLRADRRDGAHVVGDLALAQRGVRPYRRAHRAAAVNAKVRPHLAVLERCQSGHDLVGGSRRVLSLERAILKGLEPVRIKRGPGCPIDTGRESVRIVFHHHDW